jgi:hypothetical protein
MTKCIEDKISICVAKYQAARDVIAQLTVLKESGWGRHQGQCSAKVVTISQRGSGSCLGYSSRWEFRWMHSEKRELITYTIVGVFILHFILFNLSPIIALRIGRCML